MPSGSMSLDKWRDYFRTANSDIFDIIEHAIIVAASDCPYDFKLKRDQIAEVLFACKTRRCYGCDRIELAVPSDEGLEKSEDKYKSEVEAGGSKDTKESKANCSSRDDDEDDEDDDDDHGNREVMEMNANHVGNYSYGDAEALTDEIEEESQFYQEVLRLKEILDNCEDENDSLLYDSLRRLQLMHLSVEILKATEIGKSVNNLRKHGLKEIRNLARTLIEDWKVMVDSWVSATAAIAVNATESVKTSAVEDEEEAGLPSPPLDEGVFFATPTPMELSQFFDGMDDLGNPQTGGEFYKNRESGRKPTLNRTNANFKAGNPDDSSPPQKDRKPEQKQTTEPMLKKQAIPPRPNRPPGGGEQGPGRPKPLTSESGPGRPKSFLKPRADMNTNNVQRKPGTIQKKPLRPQPQEKLNRNDNEISVGMKLEAAKRKLQERYQEAENAKKQRTIQVVELQDLPKQSLAQRNQHGRPGNHNRHWANGRR